MEPEVTADVISFGSTGLLDLCFNPVNSGMYSSIESKQTFTKCCDCSAMKMRPDPLTVGLHLKAHAFFVAYTPVFQYKFCSKKK